MAKTLSVPGTTCPSTYSTNVSPDSTCGASPPVTCHPRTHPSTPHKWAPRRPRSDSAHNDGTMRGEASQTLTAAGEEIIRAMASGALLGISELASGALCIFALRPARPTHDAIENCQLTYVNFEVSCQLWAQS